MSRVQLALNVDDLEASIAFYSRLFDTEPAKVRPGYANFAVTEPPLKLVLIENHGHGGSVNHLGVEVTDTAAVQAEQARLAELGYVAREERGTTCCYAVQDKFWVRGAPNGERWEIYTVLAEAPGPMVGAPPAAAVLAEAPGPMVGAPPATAVPADSPSSTSVNGDAACCCTDDAADAPACC